MVLGIYIKERREKKKKKERKGEIKKKKRIKKGERLSLGKHSSNLFFDIIVFNFNFNYYLISI